MMMSDREGAKCDDESRTRGVDGAYLREYRSQLLRILPLNRRDRIRGVCTNDAIRAACAQSIARHTT
jgi:hypothetical protein